MWSRNCIPHILGPFLFNDTTLLLAELAGLLGRLALKMFAKGEYECSRGEDVLSVVVGTTLTRVSRNGNRPVATQNVVESISRNPIGNGVPRIRNISAASIRIRRRSMEPVLSICATTVNNIPTTCSAMLLLSENCANKEDRRR
jgi:hypothetical protein